MLSRCGRVGPALAPPTCRAFPLRCTARTSLWASFFSSNETTTDKRSYVHRLHKHHGSREHHKKDTQNRHGPVSILETGLIYFFYRPKTRVENDPYREPHGLDDVSRLYVLLSPKGEDLRAPKEWKNLTEKGPSLTAIVNNKTHPLHKRLITIPRKKLPDIDQHERLLGVVQKVGNLHDVRKVLEEGEPRKQGSLLKPSSEDASDAPPPRRQLLPEVRPVGEGVYGLVEHERHTHLAFVLELPHEPGEVQRSFNIPKEGSYHIVVRDMNALRPLEVEGVEPIVPNPGRLEREAETKLERDIRAYLDGLTPLPEEPADLPPSRPSTSTFVPVNPPTLLDQEGAQVILVGAAAHLEEELGQAGRVLKGIEEVDERFFLRSDAKPFEELHLHKSRYFGSSPPLTTGDWV